MPRVLFVNHTASLGGGEIALLNLVQELDRRRYMPTVLLFQEGPLAERLRESDIETYVRPLAAGVVNARKDGLGIGSLARGSDLMAAAAFAWRLAAFIKERDIQLVHTNSLKADLIGGLAGRLAGVPVVWHVRDRIAADYLPARVATVFRFLCRVVPNQVIAISEAVRQTVGRRARVIYDGTYCAPLIPQPPIGPSDPQSETWCGLVGRITPWKGQDVFLRAAAEVRRRIPKARFQIIGAALFDEKEFERKVHALAEELALGEAVEFTGFRNDVPDLIAKLDILVHASVTGEPFGQVVIEGMAAAKPVIATNGGGIPEIVVDGVTGILVPMGDHAAMANAMRKLLADPSLAEEMGHAGRKRVEEHFTIQHTARQVEALYDQLLR
jgi:glycosyltransferase involved in cell wall biosynthesis